MKGRTKEERKPVLVLSLKFCRKASYTILAEFKQAFIKLLKTDQDGIRSGLSQLETLQVLRHILSGLIRANSIGHCTYP